MTRRSFIDAALKAAAGFAILPSAVTYARTWKPVASGLVTPRWIPMTPAMWDPGMLSFARDSETGLVFAVLNGRDVSLCGGAWASPLALPDLKDALKP